MTDLSWGKAKPVFTIECTHLSFRGNRKWHLFSQVHDLFSASCAQVSRYSSVGSIADLITTLNIDTETELNLTVIPTDYVGGSFGMSGLCWNTGTAICCYFLDVYHS